MSTNRLEAFSDGVIAILITIMVLELHAPEDEHFEALRAVVPGLLVFVLSFAYLGIYWNNHHHMLHVTERVTGPILWANLHLLFWLALVPFSTAWMSEHHLAAAPTALYGAVLLMAALAYTVLSLSIIASQGPNSVLRRAIGRDWKSAVSIALYVLGIALAFASTWVAQGTFVLVALIWLIPDRRIERVLAAAAVDPTAEPEAP